jgi:hypothetical protein
MKINGLNLIIVVTLLFALAGCATTDVDRSVDFSRYKTFAWGEAKIKVTNPAYDSDLISKNIKTTVEGELAKRGITVNAKDPDFLISYQTYTEKKETVAGGNPYGPYRLAPFRFYPYGFGWGWFPVYGYNPPRVHSYTEGTLIIDIEDARSKEVIWRGTVSGNVDNTKKLQRQIQKGIRAIMKKYPVPAPDKLILPDDDNVS